MADAGAAGKVEVVVIGGGPGGYAAAFHASDLGKQVALVEMDPRLGGTCLLRGCIPSKALITAAEFFDRIRKADKMGIMVKDATLDMQKLGAWRDGIITGQANGLDFLCKQRGVKRILGKGTFTGPRELRIAGKEGSSSLQFDHCVLATGSRPFLPPPFVRSANVLSSDEALSLNVLPKSVLVVGGGYIGIELGSCFAALGSKVTVVELMDRLLMGTDADLVRVVKKHLDERGVAIHLEAKVVEAKDTKSGAMVKVQPKEGAAWSADYDTVLVAIGRKPCTDDMGLDKLGVQMDKGHVLVNEQCRTSVSHVFAIGDCTGNPYLAHRAKKMGMVAAEVICGKPAAFDNRTIPAVVFSDPEIAYCGLSEEEAKKAGYKVKVGRYRFAGSGRAQTMNQTEGMVNVISEEGTELILGVRMVGPNVSELLGEATLAVETGAVVEDIVGTIHAHPTLVESIEEAAEMVRGHSVHTFMARKPAKTTT